MRIRNEMRIPIREDDSSWIRIRHLRGERARKCRNTGSRDEGPKERREGESAGYDSNHDLIHKLG
jgi:hypothetical protein